MSSKCVETDRHHSKIFENSLIPQLFKNWAFYRNRYEEFDFNKFL